MANITSECDDIIFILNEKNVLINERFINSIFKKYNVAHTVKNLANYQLAMTHSSYCINYQQSDGYVQQNIVEHDIKHKKNIQRSPKVLEDEPHHVVPLQPLSYERLEFLGDATIHHILARYIYNRFEDQQEGFMTKLRAKLENSKAFAKLTKIIRLDRYILLSRYYENMNGRTDNTHILEDVFEAFIGALSIDGDNEASNFGNCMQLVVNLIETEIDIAELLHTETNYKDVLLKYAHTRKCPDPFYGTRSVTGMDNKTYIMWVRIGQKIMGEGEGNSKKQGEQAAASDALMKLGIHGDIDSSDEEYEEIN